MSTFLILGATGTVGSCILKSLLAGDDTSLVRVLVRSRAKFEKLHSSLLQNPETAKRVTVIEGGITPSPPLRDAVKGTRAVFLSVAPNGNQPGCRLLQDCAETLVKVFGEIRAEGKLPRIVLLSSASTEDKLCHNMPGWVHTMLLTSFSNIYGDLSKAEDYLRQHSSWIASTFVKPGGLSVDEAKGHILSEDTQQTFLSFNDLANGMVEIAKGDHDQWDGKSVSVLSKEKAAIEWRVPLFLLKGTITHFFPFCYSWLY